MRSEVVQGSVLCCACLPACRALEFMMAIMGRLLEKPEMGLSEVVYEQYHATLSRWHGFWASSAFNVSMQLQLRVLGSGRTGMEYAPSAA